MPGRPLLHVKETHTYGLALKLVPVHLDINTLKAWQHLSQQRTRPSNVYSNLRLVTTIQRYVPKCHPIIIRPYLELQVIDAAYIQILESMDKPYQPCTVSAVFRLGQVEIAILIKYNESRGSFGNDLCYLGHHIRTFLLRAAHNDLFRTAKKMLIGCGPLIE